MIDHARVESAQRHEEAVQRVLGVLERFLERLATEELNDLAERLARSLEQRSVTPERAELARTLSGREFSEAERLRLEQWALVEHFHHRERLLQGALTASQVAGLLGTSRQTPYDRARHGSLLAVMDRGALRFPPWQFDSSNDGGVISGLPEVVRNLRVSPLGKISWMVRPNPYLDGSTPLDCLRAGQIERVAEMARGVERT